MQNINYANIGIKQNGNPDILTIKKNNPILLTIYENTCNAQKIKSYGGGTLEKQKSGIAKITSGYRDKKAEGGAITSPHMYCLALDLYFPFSKILSHDNYIFAFSFSAILNGIKRIGFYPHKNIIHIDIATIEWSKSVGKGYAAFWAQDNSLKYTYFKTIDDLIKNILKY